MSDRYRYITTTLPYVNAEPHIGFAMEIIRADIYARMQANAGFNVFFNTGTDEHGQKIYDYAQKANTPIEEYVNKHAENFHTLISTLNIYSDIYFIRTTDKNHVSSAQAFWHRVRDNGYIYKNTYQSKYCVGCELEKTDSELVDGKCPEHPNEEIKFTDEENYFFKWSAFQKPLLDFYSSHPNFVIPDFRFNEIKAFVERGLNDFSISRLKSKMSWGVPVPDDDEHVMYVWFDALVNYISTLGWPDEGDGSNFSHFWKNGNPVQICGKDNLRQQTAMWQAMLMAAGLPNTSNIIIDGFINSGGQKMSKSLGNVISPYDIIEEYHTFTQFPEDVLRYYLVRHVAPFEDSDVTKEKITECYNSHLANGLGNLVSRLMNMIVAYNVIYDSDILNIPPKVEDDLPMFRFDLYAESIWEKVGALDAFIAEKQPFKKIKENPDEAKSDLVYAIGELAHISKMLEPLMPRTAETIMKLIKEKKKPDAPLFKRKD